MSPVNRGPFDTALKQRPAVVVSNATYNLRRPDVVVMAVTSQIRSHSDDGDVWITRWQAAGLLKPSVVKPVSATLEQRLVLRRLGSLETGDRIALSGAIRNTIG